LVQRGQVAGVGGDALSGFGVEFARCMPDARVFFGRFEAFAFYGVQMEYFRAFQVLDVP
jgi:hypothetical protein